MKQYRCTACGTVKERNFAVACPECGATGSFQPYDAPTLGARRASGRAAPAQPGRLVRLGDVSAAERQRIPTGIVELDRVAGGGLVAGSLVLLAGEPGLGKSTLTLQATASLIAAGHRAIYVTGEESAAQIRLRAERLNLDLDALPVLADTDIGLIAATLEAERPTLAVIDSVQTMSSASSDGSAGGAAQVKEVTQALMRLAKRTNTTLLLVGQVTKDSTIAGPKSLEHLVDAVLILEGDRYGYTRILRATKNRFGATDEVGLFQMRAEGMVGVENITDLQVEGGVSFGRVVCPVIEGSRPMLVEVQALVAKAAYSSASRIAIGVTEKRVKMLLAVLERYAEIDLSGHDVYVQISAGLAVNEPAIDAAVCAAIASSAKACAIDEHTAVLGEVRLGGGMGPVQQASARARELARQGYRRLVGPAAGEAPTSLDYRAAKDVSELLGELGLLDGKLAVEGRRHVPSFVFAGRNNGDGAGD